MGHLLLIFCALNQQEIANFINKGLQLLYPNGVDDSKILLLCSDAGYRFSSTANFLSNYVFVSSSTQKQLGMNSLKSIALFQTCKSIFQGRTVRQALFALCTLSLLASFTLCLNILYCNYFKGIFHTFICVFMNLLTGHRWVWSRGMLSSPLQAEETPACRPQVTEIYLSYCERGLEEWGSEPNRSKCKAPKLWERPSEKISNES